MEAFAYRIVVVIKHIRSFFVRGLKRDKFQVARRKDGNFLLNYRNHIDRKILTDGAYEREQLDQLYMMSELLGVDFFFDIGANIGLYSVRMASSRNISKIYAFEPVTENRNQLHANILLNGLDDLVDVYAVALSNTSGTVPFMKNLGNSTGRSCIKETSIVASDEQRFREVSVLTNSLDNMFSLEDKKLAFKVDVEGHEVKVLEGMRELLSANKCVVQVESFESNKKACFQFFYLLGYQSICSIADDHYFTNC